MKIENKIGYVFGHYDSRGGCTIMLGDKDFKSAVARYVTEGFCVTPDDGELWGHSLRNMADEHLVTTNVIYDPKILSEYENRDLAYVDEGGFEVVWALVRIYDLEPDPEDPDSPEYDPGDIVEIHICNPLDLPMPTEGFIWQSMAQFGEDAFGVIVR